MTPRVRFAVSTGVTILILVLVILGLWAFTAPKSQTVVPPTITLSPAQQSDQAYADGQKALSQEQTGTAIGLFQKALRYDPSNAKAKQALQDAQNSQNSATGSSTTNASTTTTVAPVPADVWTKSLNKKSLLPTAFPEFVMGVAGSGASNEAEVSASASKASAPTQSLGWTVLDFKTNAKAQGFVKNTSKELYPKNAQTVTVNGVTGYFGTDTGKQATVVFVRGRYVFEVLLTASPAASIAAQKDLGVQAGSAFAAKP